MWDALRLDVRQSFRSLRRAPTFSLIVIVTLTLAVGATAAVGSLLNALVLANARGPQSRAARGPVGPRAAGERGRATSTPTRSTRTAASSDPSRRCRCTPAEDSCASRARSGVFETRRRKPSRRTTSTSSARELSAGRFFTESDDAVVVISEGFRRRIFGNGPGIGEAIKVDAVPATVIGVAADGFDGLQFDGTSDIIVPFALMRAAAGDPSRPSRSERRGRTSRAAACPSTRRARNCSTRWPSIQSATLPAALPEAEREALLRQRLERGAARVGLFGPARTGTAPRSGCSWR